MRIDVFLNISLLIILELVIYKLFFLLVERAEHLSNKIDASMVHVVRPSVVHNLYICMLDRVVRPRHNCM